MLTALLLIAGTAEPAAACLPYDELTARLTGKYSETVVGRGLTAEGNLVEVWVSPGGETWTAVIVSPDGRSCIVDVGRLWETVTPPAKGREV